MLSYRIFFRYHLAYNYYLTIIADVSNVCISRTISYRRRGGRDDTPQDICYKTQLITQLLRYWLITMTVMITILL